MAQHLNNSIRHVKLAHGYRCVLLGALLAIEATAFAGTLLDPTRPPASIAIGQTDEVAVAPSGPLLQSVLISPQRKEAIIAGQTVKVGDKVGDARVVKITESEVVLQNGKDLQTLKLFPDLEKKPASIAAGKSDSQRNKVKDK